MKVPALVAKVLALGHGATTGGASRPKMHTLQQAASVVFALISILPLLAFAYSLYSLDAIDRWEYQMGLGVALMVALLGFYIFKLILTRISELLHTMACALSRGEASAAPSQRGLEVPGIGPISEIGEMADLVNHLWKAEAEPHMGRPVAISVMNTPSALTGRLVRVTEEGVVLSADGHETAIAYRRIVAIEAESRVPA